LSQNNEARAYAERVLDAPPSPGRAGSATDIAASLDRRFGLQRLHEDLDRRITVSLDGFSGSGLGTGTNASQAGRGYGSYSQFEADVRLGGPPVRDGSTISAYARVLADGGEPRSPVPSHDAVLGVGLRWKPWGSRVIYFAAEHQTALEDRSRQDVMLRASASLFNGGRYSDDWHPSGNGWVSRNLYLDAARYLDARYSALTIDYRTSYHHKVSPNQTVEPYGHLQLSGIKNGQVERDIRSGYGLRWNIWSGATRYDAAPHKLSVGLEFQQAFETYLNDHHGFFLTLGTRW
jgi:adsorption protein A